jgi:hypothetical protein
MLMLFCWEPTDIQSFIILLLEHQQAVLQAEIRMCKTLFCMLQFFKAELSTAKWEPTSFAVKWLRSILLCTVPRWIEQCYWLLCSSARMSGFVDSVRWFHIQLEILQKLLLICWMEVCGQLHNPTVLPLGRNPGTHWIVDWVGLRAGIDVLEKRKISYPH